MNSPSAKTACVTGATGLVGSWIVRLLSKRGWHIRVLTRNEHAATTLAEVYHGGLNDMLLLESFVSGADAIFHCAAELRDEGRMHQTNVEGTSNLLAAAADKGISYFCHLSSVGVMGPSVSGLVDESTNCSPVGPYETSKLEAEKLVRESGVCDRVIILRPTNVIDTSSPGILVLSEGGVRNALMLFYKGGERAHLVHAEDVASAALHFLDLSFYGTECYIVAQEEMPSTVSEVCSCLRELAGEAKVQSLHLPWRLAYWIRTSIKGSSLKGNVMFSSKRLLEKGFEFKFDLHAMLADYVENKVRQ